MINTTNGGSISRSEPINITFTPATSSFTPTSIQGSTFTPSLNLNIAGDLQTINRRWNSGLVTIGGTSFYKKYSENLANDDVIEVVFEDDGSITLSYQKFESTTHTQTIGTWDSSGITPSGDFVINATSQNADSIQPIENDGRVTILEFGHGA